MSSVLGTAEVAACPVSSGTHVSSSQPNDRTPKTPPPSEVSLLAGDSSNTPTRSNPGSTTVAPRAPQGKDLRPVFAGIGAMHRYCVEEPDTQRFLDSFLPGPDPTEADYEKFHYPGKWEKGTREVDVNTTIVRFLHILCSNLWLLMRDLV